MCWVRRERACNFRADTVPRLYPQTVDPRLNPHFETSHRVTDREVAKFHADFFELDSNFFIDLPVKSGSRRFGALFDSTTWKSNLSRPGVPLSLRPLNKER